MGRGVEYECLSIFGDGFAFSVGRLFIIVLTIPRVLLYDCNIIWF